MKKFEFLTGKEILCIHVGRLPTKTSRRADLGYIGNGKYLSLNNILKMRFKNKNISKAIVSVLKSFEEDYKNNKFSKLKLYYADAYGLQLEIDFVTGFNI